MSLGFSFEKGILRNSLSTFSSASNSKTVRLIPVAERGDTVTVDVSRLNSAITSFNIFQSIFTNMGATVVMRMEPN